MKVSIIVVFALVCITSQCAENELGRFKNKLLLLKSNDTNVRREAFDELYEVLSIEIEDRRPLVDALIAYLKRWDEHSSKAALLIGKFGDKADIPVLNKALQEASLALSADSDRKSQAPQMITDCTFALVRLGDDNAVKVVKEWISSNGVEFIAKGIEACSYAKRSDLASILAPLLDDKRDAVNIAPSGGQFFLRVCDLAANAIAKAKKITPSFDIQRGIRYTDAQLLELKASILK